MLALERLDDIEKPQLLARFFLAYMRSEIDYVIFTRLARAVDRFNLALLPSLRRFYAREEPYMEISEEFMS